MTERRTIELTGEDLDLLAAQLGESWVDALLCNQHSRHDAVVRLCRAVNELTDLEFSMAARLMEAAFSADAGDDVALAIAELVPDTAKRSAVVHLAIATLISNAVANVFTSQMPQHNRHQRRVDGRGCTCGWSGRDMLAHLLEIRRRQEVIALAPLDELANELGHQLLERFRDPDWAARYWVARSARHNDIGILIEQLRMLGAVVDQHDGEYHLRFPIPVELPGADYLPFPIAIDAYDWTRPPGRFVARWAEVAGLNDKDAAARCDLPVETYQEILAGSAHITTDIAAKLEAGTATFPANVWLMLERHYRAALVERANQPHH